MLHRLGIQGPKVHNVINRICFLEKYCVEGVRILKKVT